MKAYIIVGLTHREAQYHWHRLAEERPEMRDRHRVITLPIESALSKGVLRGRRPERTEVFIHERAWRHRCAPRFSQEVRMFEAVGGTVTALCDHHPTT